MADKSMTSVKIPENLEKELLVRVVEEGYGLRGKSRWIEDALIEFLKLEDFVELTDIAEAMENCSKTMSIRLTESTQTQLESAIHLVRKAYPMIEGVKSNILRASILQRLFRPVGSVTEPLDNSMI